MLLMATSNLDETVEEWLKEELFDPEQGWLLMQLKCMAEFEANPVATEPGSVYCNATFDNFSCWPTAKAGTTALQGCPDVAISDLSLNVTKHCYDNGTWGLANYNVCVVAAKTTFMTVDMRSEFPVRVIYACGHAVTALALVIALIIFGYFKSLRCLRNTIHCQLLIAFLLSIVCWGVNHMALGEAQDNAHGLVCRLLFALYNYFHTAAFFWMFVEGLYLYTIVVWAFSAQKIRLWHYMIIGWVIPLVILITWAIAKSKLENNICWLPLLHPKYDYIVHGPVIFVLALNVYFIVAIVWVLVTKLRASNTLETRQSRKAVRATLVLLPLLGLTYIMFILPPFENSTLDFITIYANSAMQSLQGLFVAVIYCFLNGEVQTVLRKKIRSFQDNRALTRYTKSSIFSSPHRSSCYAMGVVPNGKSAGSKRSSNGTPVQGKAPPAEPETEASVSMMDNML